MSDQKLVISEEIKEKILNLHYKLGYSTQKIAYELNWYGWKGITTKIINILGYESWEEYDKGIRRIRGRNRYAILKEAGWYKARKKTLERDNYKCVITGNSDNIEVHHIDGNVINNNLENLVTLWQEVHVSVTHGANLSFLKENRIKHICDYLDYLHKNEYGLACLELHIR